MRDIYVEMIIVAVIYAIVTTTLLLVYRYVKKSERETYSYNDKARKDKKLSEAYLFVPKLYFLRKISLALVIFFTCLVSIVEIILYIYSLK